MSHPDIHCLGDGAGVGKGRTVAGMCTLYLANPVNQQLDPCSQDVCQPMELM